MIKMKNKSIYTLLSMSLIVLSISVYSCKSEQNNSNIIRLSDINYSQWNKIMYFSDAIQLGNDSCVLTTAIKCYINGNDIYFCDYKSKKIYLFDEKGKLCRIIGELGKANSEYVEFRDVRLSPDKSLLCVLETRGVVCYDSKSGKFVKRAYQITDNSIIPDQFMPLKNNDFLFYNSTDIKYRIFHLENNELVSLRDGKCRNYVTDKFYIYRDNYRVLSDMGEFYIDEYNEGKLTRLYTFDMGSESIPKDILPQDFSSLQNVMNMPEYFKGIDNALETSKWLFMKLDGPKLTYYHVFINKESGKYYAGPVDQSMGMVVVDAYDEDFYALVYPDYVKEGSNMHKFLKSKGLNLKGNPILVKFNINETL